jgi:hypothetical protein
MRTLWRDEDGAWRTTLRGRQVLADPRINKGTAFGDGERRDLGLTGLIPAAHFTLDDQLARVYAQYRRQPDDLARNVTAASAGTRARRVLDDDNGTLPSSPVGAAQPSPSQPAVQRDVRGAAPAKSGR